MPREGRLLLGLDVAVTRVFGESSVEYSPNETADANQDACDTWYTCH